MRNFFCIILCFFCVLFFAYSEANQISNDNFTVSEKNHNNLVYTYLSDNYLIRKEYDENKRLILKINWDIETENMISKISYSYLEDSMLPFASETVFFLESITEKREYSSLGKDKNVKIYKDENLVSETKYDYDSNGRTVSFVEKLFETNESKNQLKLETKILYEYVIFGEKEYKNEFHFENQIKTKEKIYLSNNKYFENVFFEDDIKIYSEYEDGKKILEITYYQEKEIRRKENRW